tara:strand:+ start:81 stop:269 length:189 start_codon:yes stop_codon:yes gene_type:complete
MNKNNIKKVIIWRFFSTPIGVLLTYSYLGEITKSIELSLIFIVLMTFLHYVYEEWWDWRSKK